MDESTHFHPAKNAIGTDATSIDDQSFNLDPVEIDVLTERVYELMRSEIRLNWARLGRPWYGRGG